MIVAVLGTGSIGSRHLEVLGGFAQVQTIAVPIRKERFEELRSKGIRAARNLTEAVEQGARLCIIATDTGRHVSDTLMALQSSCAVLVEKPMSIDRSGAAEVCRAATKAGQRVFVCCVLRFSESLNTFRELLPTLGRLHSVRIECQSYLPDWRPQRSYRDAFCARPNEGGVLLDLIHEVDYATWLYGWPSAIYACLRNLRRLDIQAEETADLLWETSDGCLVSIALDYLSRPPRRLMTAKGEHGTIQWDGISGTVSIEQVGLAVEHVKSSQTRDDMMSGQAQAFLNAIAGTVDQRLASIEDGIRAAAVCDGARRSSQTLRREAVEYGVK